MPWWRSRLRSSVTPARRRGRASPLNAACVLPTSGRSTLLTTPGADMTDLFAFPIATRWKSAHPDRIQLYSFPTPNGVKVSIALEELGLPYEPHPVDITRNESWTPEFLSLNPNGKIPAIIDPDGPGGKPIGLFESGAILLYLAEKTSRLIPADAARR